MKEIKLYFFGVPRIIHNGHEISVSRRKSVALLAYLVATGPASRQSLATFLWPETNSHRALANLRNALNALGKTLIGNILEADRDKIWFNVSRQQCTVDLLEFLRLIKSEKTADLSQAIKLYCGDFLSGFTIKDSVLFEQWHLQESLFLRQSCVNILIRLFDHYKSQLKLDSAISCAIRIVDLDPLNESAWRRIMRTLVLAGQKNQAVAYYRKLVKILDSELQLPPDDETESLIRKIESGELKAQVSMESVSESKLNVPIQPTPFIGRKNDISHIVDLLLEPEHRIVTITGPGGSGKTRVAMQVAETIAPRYQDGIVWVSYESVESCEFIGLKIAEALNLKAAQLQINSELGNYPDLYKLNTQLALHLQNKEMLLVLDNFEHLADNCSFLPKILSAVPGIQFLITSRVRTNLHSEWIFEIHGLNLPQNSNPKNISKSDSVRLFCQAARQSNPSFRLNPGNNNIIVEICRKLQGIPLALEMAAARTKTLDCTTILTEFQKNPDFLTTTAQDLPERHCSIRMIFRQTWNRLSSNDREGFLKLSVFHGGFTREAALSVTGTSHRSLSSLIDFSVLRRLAVNRYEIHELLRQYAYEILEQDRHRLKKLLCDYEKYYMEMLNTVGSSMTYGDQKKAFRTMALESGNMRAAWLQAAETGAIDHLRRASMAMFLFYDQKFYFYEGYKVFSAASKALETSCSLGTQPDKTNLKYMNIFKGFSACMQSWFLRFAQQIEGCNDTENNNEFTKINRYMELGLSLLKPFSDQREWALVNILAISLKNQWNDSVSWKILEKCHDIFNAHNDLWGLALTFQTRGCWYFAANPMKAKEFQLKALEIRKQANDSWGLAQSHNSVGLLLHKMGKYEEAKIYFMKSISILRDLEENPNELVHALLYMAYASDALKQYEEAFLYLKEGLTISETMNNLSRTSLILGNLGLLQLELKNYASAASYLNQCLSLCSDAGLTKHHAYFSNFRQKIPG